MNTTLLDNAIEEAFNAALNNSDLFNYEETKSLFFQPPTPVNGDVDQTVEVHVYKHVSGQKGFRVVGRLKEGLFLATRVKNSGPDVDSEKPWGNLDEQYASFLRGRDSLAEQFINQYFNTFDLVELSKKLAVGSFAVYPKAAATLEWVDICKAIARIQETPNFPAPPYPVAEVVSE